VKTESFPLSFCLLLSVRDCNVCQIFMTYGICHRSLLRNLFEQIFPFLKTGFLNFIIYVRSKLIYTRTFNF
jgi:hypothetical protein